MSDENIWVLYDGDATYGTCKVSSDKAGTATLTVDAMTLGALSPTGNVTFTLGSTEAFTLTCTDISAPMVMTNTMATAGTTGCRALFNVKANVALGSYCNALKGYMEFTGTSGRTTGLASGVCAELKTANATLASGAYYPVECEYVAGGTSTASTGSGSRVGFLWLQHSGDINGDFDDYGYLMTAVGLTAGAGHLLSAQSVTLRCQVGISGAESTRYLVMSSAENNLTLATTGGTSIAVGACTSGIVLSGAITTGITISSTSTADGILIDGTTPADGIHISSACSGNGINLSGGSVTAINIAAPTTTGIMFAGDAAYNPIVIGTKASTSATGGLNLVGITDDTGGIMVFCDDGGAALSSITSPIWTRYLITKVDQSSGSTATGAYLQTKTVTGMTMNTGSYTATKCYMQIGGTLALQGGAECAIINAGMTLEGAVNQAAGRLSGIDVNISNGGTGGNTITDTATDTAGIHIRKVAASTIGWPVGLKINDAGAVTGIKIGTCTTGMTITGATAQALYATVTAVDNTGSLTGSALCVYAIGQAGKNDVGIVAYLDATAKGQSTGNWTYGAGIWLNIDSTFAHTVDPGGWANHEQLCALNTGVYIPSGVGGVDDCDVVYGIKAELVGNTAASTTNGCYFAALNVSQTAATKTAIFFAHQGEAVGLTTAKTTAGGALALVNVNGTMYYVNLYTA